VRQHCFPETSLQIQCVAHFASNRINQQSCHVMTNKAARRECLKSRVVVLFALKEAILREIAHVTCLV